jgi:hypothetical protein
VKEVLPDPPAPVDMEATLEELLIQLKECKKTLTIEEVREELTICREMEYEAELLELATIWTGYYNQWDVDYEMTFEELFIGDSTVVIGQGTDGLGDFHLEGTRSDSYVVFDKYYSQHP